MHRCLKLKRAIALLLVILHILVLSSCSQNTKEIKSVLITASENNDVVVQFLDVGQADCSLICLPDGRNILIDAGNEGDAVKIVEYLRSIDVKYIDYLIGTHPHEDHIGGLDTVVENIVVGTVILPKIDKSDITGTVTYESVLMAIKNAGKNVTQAVAGLVLINEAGIKLECLWPEDEDYSDLNEYSAVLMFTYGDTKILFTGDAEKPCEERMLQICDSLDADILKVGHHGSETSSSKDFLEAVSPDYAVISCGAGNSYNHPHKEVLDRLNEQNSTVLRTDLSGTVTFVISLIGIKTISATTDIDLNG